MANDPCVELSDSKSLTVTLGTTWSEAIKQLDPALYGRALVVKLGDQLLDMTSPVPEGRHRVKALDFSDPEGEEVFRHSTAHLMAAAVKELFPETKVTIGPSIQDGFYYDFDREKPFVPEELIKIEERMHEIAQRKPAFSRRMVSRAEARTLFAGQNETYKLELLDAIGEDTEITLYTLGEFTDLCRGPHVPHAGVLKAFKLLSVAGAYWRGDERNKMLQRIYGTSFDKAKALEEYLAKMEEAKRRDHRKLGKELDLFSLHEDAGAGLVYSLRNFPRLTSRSRHPRWCMI